MIHPRNVQSKSSPSQVLNFLPPIPSKQIANLRGPQFTMPNANAWTGMGPKVKSGSRPHPGWGHK